MFLRICLVVCLALAAVNGRVAKPKPFLTQELIDEINAAQTTWKAGPSKFMLWPEKSVKRLMGVRPEYFEQHKLITPIEHEVPADLPDNLLVHNGQIVHQLTKFVIKEGRFCLIKT
jgi:hypothetical protein